MLSVVRPRTATVQGLLLALALSLACPRAEAQVGAPSAPLAPAAASAPASATPAAPAAGSVAVQAEASAAPAVSAAPVAAASDSQPEVAWDLLNRRYTSWYG